MKQVNKRANVLRCAILSVLLFILMNIPGVAVQLSYGWHVYAVVAVLFVVLNIVPLTVKRPSFRLLMVSDGASLLCAFLITLCAQIIYTPLVGFLLFRTFDTPLIVHLCVVTAAEFIIFWNGILRIYIFCGRIGMKWRVLGLVFGFILPINIIVLIKIILLSYEELASEEERYERNRARLKDKICATKYPILFVHGVCFRDIRHISYWGRIPSELKLNGAEIYYGGQQSALSVDESARELSHRIEEIAAKSGKVNIIAHSKGGLDCRCAITKYGADKYVASLTTVNTPHRGCVFADWVIDKASDKQREKISGAYNAAMKKLGDKSPDFMAAMTDLRATTCEKFNAVTPDSPDVYYQSVGSCINKPFRGFFPLNFSNMFVKQFDGENDGLVNIDSSNWGERFIKLHSNSPEGISHAEVIDAMRHDIPDFDVREFYIGLVSELKDKGF